MYLLIAAPYLHNFLVERVNSHLLGQAKFLDKNPQSLHF